MNSLSKRKIVGILIAVILVISVPVTLFLTRQSQDIRQRASEKAIIVPTINLVGQPVLVWNSAIDNCGPTDIPDSPPRAFRDSNNIVHLISAVSQGFELQGASLDTVSKNKQDCHLLFQSLEDPSFDNQQYHEWLTSPYTIDGKTVYNIMHSEWYGYLAHINPIPLYQVINPSFGDYFYTTSIFERDQTAKFGYTQPSTCCGLFNSRVPVSVPFYRLYNKSNGQHFFTASENEKNNLISSNQYALEFLPGSIGYCYLTAQPNTEPLYRFYNKIDGRHMYSTSENIKNSPPNGYTYESIACYTPLLSSTPPLCTTNSELTGWVNSINLGISTNGGSTYSHPSDYKIISPPTKWNDSYTCTANNPTVYGAFLPSNVIYKNGHYYNFYKSREDPNHVIKSGSCLMRTSNLGIASSWEIWSEGKWINSRTAACTPIQPQIIQEMHQSITYNSYLKKYVLLGTIYNQPAGVYISLSDDLFSWTVPQMVLSGPESDYTYPVLLDPQDNSRNFEITGQNPFIYYVKIDGKTGARSIMRQQITFVLPTPTTPKTSPTLIVHTATPTLIPSPTFSPTTIIAPSNTLTPTPPLLTSTPPPTPTDIISDYLKCDFDKNGKIDIFDFNLWKEAFTKVTDKIADCDGDGKTTIFDFNLWKEAFIKQQ